MSLPPIPPPPSNALPPIPPPPPKAAAEPKGTPPVAGNRVIITKAGEYQKLQPWTNHEWSGSPAELSPDNFHNYQVDMLNYLIAHPKEAMLWVALGLGKTSSILSLLAYRRSFGDHGRMLIVAPKTVCELTWRQEAKKWAHTQGLRVENMCGSIKHKQSVLFQSTADIVLLNYEALGWLQLQLNAYWIDQGLEIPFDYLVFDEISKMKRHDSNRFKEFSPVCKHFKTRIGLTASPASNGIDNVWGQFFVLDDGFRLGADHKRFLTSHFRKTDGVHGKYVPYNNDATKNMVVNAVADMTIEIPAEGNLELPKVTFIDREIILSPKVMKQYVQLEKELFTELDCGGEVEVFNQVALSNKLIQTASGRVYMQEDPEDISTRETLKVHNLKFDELDTIIDESGDASLFIAYGFTSERDEILRRHPDARSLTGVSEAEAIEIMNDFNTGKLKILVAHPASAGHGLNLQYHCHTIVWFGATYNLEFYLQFCGRIDRQGQKNPVTIIRIMARDTIERKVYNRLAEKKMDEDDIKNILSEIQKSRK